MNETGIRKANILIVDDSAMMRALLRRVATMCDVLVGEIFEASNGKEAIAILEKHDVHAVFTDINMPVMSGTELLREIERHEKWRSLTKVIISTDGSAARRHEAEQLNVRLYVEKPFRPEVMRDVLSEISATHGTSEH